MRALLVLPAALLMFVAAAASVPWIVWGIGLDVLGDSEAAERVLDHAPMALLYDYLEGRRNAS